VTGPRADVPALLSAMDVLISPSRDETFGMAVLEGIGAGLPVVHAECPALDALPAPVPGAFPIGTRDDAAEERAIAAAVEAALAFAPGLRLPVPTAVLEAYDITRTTDRLDALVDEGVARRRRTA
jgi:glycosyltransferase involved in cell wall biosynthesis